MTKSDLSGLFAAIDTLCTQKNPVLAAIDGRCASGKTTLAARLRERFGCSVIHTDHFFLRPQQRTPQRYQEPGGNMDRERLLEEVLQPLHRGEPVQYCPFLCHNGRLGDPILVPANGLILVEGSYSCHPELRSFYDLTVFLTVSPEEQLRRILHREGPEKTEIFRQRWIPLEEHYFSAHHTAECCRFCLDTSDAISSDVFDHISERNCT